MGARTNACEQGNVDDYASFSQTLDTIQNKK